MHLKTWFSALILAIAAPAALAVPVTLTTTSSGTVIDNDMRVLSDIAAGERFELTATVSYDTNWITNDPWYYPEEELMGVPVEATLNVGARTYTFRSALVYEVSADISQPGEAGRLGLTMHFEDAYSGAAYRISQLIRWAPGAYSIGSLLSGTADLTYAAPFELSTYFFETVSSEPTGELRLQPDATHISITAVPEPATYGMMLGGLILVGAVARARCAA